MSCDDVMKAACSLIGCHSHLAKGHLLLTDGAAVRQELEG